MEKRYGPWTVRRVRRLTYDRAGRVVTPDEATMYVDGVIETREVIEAHFTPEPGDTIPTIDGLRQLRYDLARDWWPMKYVEVHLHLPTHVDGMEIHAW